MNTKTALTALLGLASAASAFEFTGPKSSEDLDLSKNITVTWDKGNSSMQKSWPEFDLEWYARPDDLHSFSWDITQGLNVSDGKYTFALGKNSHNTLKPFVDAMVANKTFSFKAILKNGDKKGPEVSSDKYKVTGIDKMPNAGSAVVPMWGTFVGGLVAVSVMII